MELNIKVLIKRIVLVLLISILLELIIFNYTFFLNSFFYNVGSENVIYSKNQMETINWKKNENGTWISEIDPMIIINDINMDVKNITIKVASNKEIPYIDIFYKGESIQKEDNNEIYKRYEGPFNSARTIKINDYIENIRIDLGDEQGLNVDDVVFIFNDFSIKFSVARIIAMNMIYWGALILFMAQTPPKYNI